MAFPLNVDSGASVDPLFTTGGRTKLVESRSFFKDMGPTGFTPPVLKLESILKPVLATTVSEMLSDFCVFG